MTKPAPVYLTADDDRVLATASVQREPAKSDPRWYWRATFTDPSTEKRTHVGLGRLTEEEVPEALRDKIAEVAPSLVSTDGTGIRTLDALVEAWAAWIESRGPAGSKQLRPNSVRAYLGCAVRLMPYVRGVTLSRISRPKYRSIREAMDASDMSRNTVNVNMRALNQAMIWGREMGIDIPPVRTARITRMKVEREHRVYSDHTPTHDDVGAVFNAVRRGPTKLIMYIQWVTGARVGEVVLWRPDVGPNGSTDGLPVDDSGAWIYLPRRKNGGDARLPITHEEREMILSLIPGTWEPGQPVFAAWAENNMHATVARVAEKIGVTPFNSHGLRRLMDDTMLRRGVELGVYADLMDHSPETALKHYRQPNDDDRRGALAKTRSTGENLSRWLSKRGMTEDDALALLRGALGDKATPNLRVIEGEAG